jgi:DNA-binding Xre family transcriptional regulator
MYSEYLKKWNKIKDTSKKIDFYIDLSYAKMIDDYYLDCIEELKRLLFFESNIDLNEELKKYGFDDAMLKKYKKDKDSKLFFRALKKAELMHKVYTFAMMIEKGVTLETLCDNFNVDSKSLKIIRSITKNITLKEMTSLHENNVYALAAAADFVENGFSKMIVLNAISLNS